MSFAFDIVFPKANEKQKGVLYVKIIITVSLSVNYHEKVKVIFA